MNMSFKLQWLHEFSFLIDKIKNIKFNVKWDINSERFFVNIYKIRIT